MRQRHPGASNWAPRHAAAGGERCAGGFSGTLLIVNGDMPLITAEVVGECLKAQAATGLALLAFEPADAAPVWPRAACARRHSGSHRANSGRLTVRARRHPVQRRLLCVVDARKFFDWTSLLKNDNAQGEYYLTDVPSTGARRRHRLRHRLADEVSVSGVNQPRRAGASRSHVPAAQTRRAAERRRHHDRAGNGVLRP